MTVEGVFDVGASGMGPALTPKGEAVVNARMERQSQVLDSLAARGIDARALTHCCHAGCSCGHESCPDEPEVQAIPTLEGALDRLKRQEAQIEHLQHQVAVQRNQILLLREALAKGRAAKQEEARQ